MTTTSSALREELIKRLKKQKGIEDNAPAFVAPVPPPEVIVPEVVVDREGKTEYSKIIGHPHPSGKEYFFTVHKKDDWEEDLQELIPAVDDNHVFDHDYAMNILMAIEFDKVAFAYGPPGSGKSVTPEQICARINYPFMFIAGMGGTEPSDYVGSPWVEEGSMTWRDGPASYAVRKGVFMLYDEPFKASAQTNMCFQSLMDSRRTLKLYGHPDPIKGNLKAHPKFRMMLADNVRGFGDDMDKYSAEIQDQSTLNRCAYKVHVDYVPAATEKKILKNKFSSATDVLIDKVVSMANLIREGWKKGDISAPYSIRDTQEMMECALFYGEPAPAFKQTYYNAIKDRSEQQALQDIWRTVFGSASSL